MAPQSRRGTCSAHFCVNVCVETPGEKCPDVKKPNVQVSALCNCVVGH